LFLKREHQLVIQLVETVLGMDLSFVCQVDKLGLKLIEGLNLVYSQLLVFTSSFAYAVRVDEVFTEVVDYLHSRLERVSGIRLVSSVQVALGIALYTVEYIVYAGILICIVVYINFEFADNLDLPIVIGWAFAITKLRGIRNLYGAELAILRNFSGRTYLFDRRNGGVGYRIMVLRLGADTTRSVISANRTSSGKLLCVKQAS
jgi:hypothetical protein